jgi:hypothetical protein
MRNGNFSLATVLSLHAISLYLAFFVMVQGKILTWPFFQLFWTKYSTKASFFGVAEKTFMPC